MAQIESGGGAASITSPDGTRKTSLADREVHRYYSPWLSAHGSSLNVASNVDSIAKLDLHGKGYKPQPSRDKALTAFAQLAALRLNVKTAMVSLIDSNNQMILAEATRTQNVNSSEDLWLGSTVLTRSDAVCEHCMFNTYTARDDSGETLTARALVLEDLSQDDRFKHRPYVRSEPGIRFYAGVPISTRQGVMIGAYAVSDEKPRHKLTVDELRFMQETSQAVMEHLEWARDRVDRYKGDRIVRGMAAFIEGCGSLEKEESVESATSIEDSGSARALAEPLSTRTQSPSRPEIQAVRNDAASPPRSSRPPVRRTTSMGKTTKPDGAAAMFARAADILRESTIADGAVIFGGAAGSTSIRGLSKRVPASGPTYGSSSTSPPTGTSGQRVPPDSDSSAPEIATSDSDTSPLARPCKILAFSLADERAKEDIEQGSALTLGTLEKYFAMYPKGRVFSFSENGSGLSSEDESSANEREPRRRSPKRPAEGTAFTSSPAKGPSRRRRGHMDHRELLKKIPGAKSVVFLPLYDFTEEKLMAGCFLWTSVTGRMMNLDDDMSYLRAFGNSIMSEVARLNVQKNEAAKTTFIASMSHELRSPLHGILGAAEFLVDTAADSYQAGLISSIATCGKTLLDTLNHVLDYSKINKLGRAQMRKNAKQNKLVKLISDSANMDSINMTAEVDLGVLVEEVVEAVTAGHSFKKLHNTGSMQLAVVRNDYEAKAEVASVNGISSGVNDEGADTGVGNVSVLLDISPRRSWTVRTQPGALRRIIMNLLGNALKYTSSGFVAVSLRAQENAASLSKVNALIRVVDSGKGMSEEFQRNRLFVPFSQEDSFQPGTGLGLSIVKQIVDSLGGSVDVKSQQGMGTEVEVRVSLPAAGNQLAADGLLAVAEQTRGLQMVLLDPCLIDDKPRALTHQIARLQETLGEVCTSWFDMRVVKAGNMDLPAAEMFLYSEPPTIDFLLEHRRSGRLKTPRGTEIPIIIICMNVEEAIEVGKNQSRKLGELGTIVEVIPQPCGPRKLGRVLAQCLRRMEEARRQNDEGGDEAEGTTPGEARGERESSDEHADSLRVPSSSPRPPVSPGLERREASRSMPLSSAVSFPSPPPLRPETPSLDQQLLASEHKQHTSATPAATSDSSAVEQASSPLHVLLVDDNKINLQLLTMFMKKCRYSYAEAENGQEALDKYRESCLPGPHTSTNAGQPQRRFDYVLMDISMPVMNGMEATKRIRDFERENGLRKAGVIALTGLASKEAQKEAEACGVDVFLPKVSDAFV